MKVEPPCEARVHPGDSLRNGSVPIQNPTTGSPELPAPMTGSSRSWPPGRVPRRHPMKTPPRPQTQTAIVLSDEADARPGLPFRNPFPTGRLSDQSPADQRQKPSNVRQVQEG